MSAPKTKAVKDLHSSTHLLRGDIFRLVPIVECHFYDRPIVCTPCPNNVVEKGEENHRPRHQHGKVHMRRRHGSSYGPKAEEENDGAEHDSKDID